MVQKYADVDEYVASFPPEVAEVLTELRRRVHVVAPDVVESISYDMPTFSVGGARVAHVAGWTKHVSIYPVPESDCELARELAPYRDSRSTLRFPLDAPVPYDLVERAVRGLVVERSGP